MSAVVFLPPAVQAFLWPRRDPTCDWGGCHEPTVGVRYAADCGEVSDEKAWLGVCATHAEPVGNDDFKPRGPVKARKDGRGGR